MMLPPGGGGGNWVHVADGIIPPPPVLVLLGGEPPGVAGRWRRGARVRSSLEHPGIVKLLATGTTHDGEPYLAMEWLEGEDVSHRIAREPLTQGDSISVVTRAAEALAIAHARGVVHR